MFDPGNINQSEFNYHLPSNRIAQFPLADRDASKLLLYRHGEIRQEAFINIDGILPDNSLLVFNVTKVIHARLLFTKQGGATIEIFCLEPLSPSSEIQVAFRQKGSCTWKCLVGNLKRWKNGTLQLEIEIKGKFHFLSAILKEDLGDGFHAVEFSWNPPELTFSEILETVGLVPLPPYIHRLPDELDTLRYQTIYAEKEGSVAAPTAGLHFTEQIFNKLKTKQCLFEQVTLHVGVGTFRPITTSSIADHVMHKEKITVKLKTIESIYNRLDQPIIAVGTTSARTIETLYWLGVRLSGSQTMQTPEINQWEPYQYEHQDLIPVKKALENLLEFLIGKNLDEYSGETQLMIVPGYSYKIITGLITNFHMPQSSLLLLVAALVGDNWRKAYQFALEHDFRFLSYGDACLFFKNL